MIAKNEIDPIATPEQRVVPQATPVPGHRRSPGRPKGSTARTKKWKKPYASFPLTRHASGQFCKKIKGKILYFGTDADAAVQRYREQCEGLHSGRLTVVDKSGRTTIGDLVNRFLTNAQTRQQLGQIAARTFVDYYRDCKRLVEYFGKSKVVESITPEELAELRIFLANDVNLVTLNGRVGVTRSVFGFAYENEMIAAPLKLKALKRPTRKELRKTRKESGREYFYPEEIRTLLDLAPTSLRAMTLLGVNCGLGNTDIASLPTTALDLNDGWLHFARVKTGVDRRSPLWPETVQAIRDHLKTAKRGETDETRGLLFVTIKGHKFVRSVLKETDSGPPQLVEHDAIVTSFKRLMDAAGIDLPGVAFYGLRKSCETFGGETGEQVAVDHIMGHAPDSDDMGDTYRAYVAAEPLRRVTDHIRKKIFAKNKRGST